MANERGRRIRIKALLMSLVIMILASPPVIVGILRRDELTFSPARFIDQYLAFLSSLVAILFGFLLIHAYWSQRQRTQTRRELLGVLITALDHLHKLIVHLDEQLMEPGRTSAGMQEEQESLAANLEAISATLRFLDSIRYRRELVGDSNMLEAIFRFNSYVYPILYRISQTAPNALWEEEKIQTEHAREGLSDLIIVLKGGMK